MGYNLRASVSWMDKQWHQRLVQIAVFSALIFWLLSSYKLIDSVNKYIERIFKVKFGGSGTRILHAIIFGCIQFAMIKYVLDPFVKVVEGADNGVDEQEEKVQKQKEESDHFKEEAQQDAEISIVIAKAEAAAAVSDHVEKFEHMLPPMGEAEVLQPPDANGGE